MIFSDGGVDSTVSAADAFETSLLAHGAVKNAEKDVNDTLSAVCVGVELVDGTHWKPPGHRLWLLFDAVLDLSATRCASPAATAAYLGVTQWYNLLRRLKLSVFSRVYRFCSGSLATDWTQRLVPSEVMLELLLDAALHAFCTVDMRRPHLPFLGATDASTSFGLGATVAPMSPLALRRIARLSCKAGGHVTMEGGPPLPQRQSERLGPRRHLGLNLRDFKVVLSIRRGSPDHVNLEEARALLRYVQWVLRTRRHFGHRLVVLLDSKVAIGAVTKGRSGSLPLNRLVRKLAALCFAGGLVLHCVFVPTSHNPADWPSRGGPASWPRELRGRGERCPRGARRQSRLDELRECQRLAQEAGIIGVAAAHRARISDAKLKVRRGLLREAGPVFPRVRGRRSAGFSRPRILDFLNTTLRALPIKGLIRAY